MADFSTDAYTLDPGEVARMEQAAREGQLERVDRWAAGILEDVEKKDPRRRAWPPEVLRTLDDLYEVATAVDLARRGQVDELRDYLGVLVDEPDTGSPEHDRLVVRLPCAPCFADRMPATRSIRPLEEGCEVAGRTRLPG